MTITSTTIPASTVPAAISYLMGAIEEQVANDPDAASILLTLADPSAVVDAPAEIISVGEVRRQTAPSTMIGSGAQFWLNETYTIDCNVWAWTGSSDSDGAYTIQLEQVQRVWQLYEYVDTAIRLDPGLGTNALGQGLVDIAYPRTTTQPTVSWTAKPVGTGILLAFDIYVEKLN